MAPRPLLITSPEPAAAPAARGSWLALSAAFTAHVEDLSGRGDLTVTCAPGAGRGAPGCFIPALATIELDGTHLGHHPATCDPSRPSDRDRYPALWGVLVHEAAHAAHSAWTTSGQPPGSAHTQAAILLEESRIEAAHLRARPADRHWLRASARKLILDDFTPDPASTPAVPGTPSVAMTPWDAARAAALLLARVDAGVLDTDETNALASTVTGILGPSRLGALAALWHLAHTTADHNAEAMLDLGRRWCRILGADPDQPPPEPGDADTAEPSALSEAITTTLVAVASTDAPPPTLPAGPDKTRQRHQEKKAQQRARDAARRVFAPDSKRDSDAGRAPFTGTRPPTTSEQAAARRLARALRAAAHRERVTVHTTSATPPGRLRMREALAADAQRAAGATPTAQPFRTTTHRHVPAPPLRLGVACDISGSMYELAAPVASAAWILARAASHLPDTRSATVLFGEHVWPVTHPGQAPARVRKFTAMDFTEEFVQAVDALDAAVELTRPGAARLLVVVSDGFFTDEQLAEGQHRIDRLVTSGCAVLWLALGDHADPMNGVHLVTLNNPVDAATIIGKAAAHALRRT